MSQDNVREIRPQKRRREDKLASIPDEQVECRGGRHLFPYDIWNPKTEPRKPTGMDVDFDHTGVYLIRERCTRGCGRVRNLVTAPREFGVIDRRWYEDPDKTWITIHEVDDYGISKSDFRQERFRRNQDVIAKLFRVSRQGSAEAKFSGGAS